MTDTRPEYSPEQVRTAVSELRRYSSGFNFSWAITAVLSALAKADDSRAEWERTANAFAADVVGYVEEIASLRSRLEGAERDNERLLIENRRWVPRIEITGASATVQTIESHSPTPTQGGTNG